MESEKVKEIKELIDCDKKQNELGGIIVVNRQFLIEVIALINELESENESCHEVLADLKAIIKQQNDRIAELEKEKVDALTQLAERLKDMPFNIEFTFKESSYEDIKKLANLMKEYSVKYIDETLKEFMGEQK